MIENLLFTLAGNKAGTLKNGKLIVLGDRTVVRKERAKKLEYGQGPNDEKTARAKRPKYMGIWHNQILERRPLAAS